MSKTKRPVAVSNTDETLIYDNEGNEFCTTFFGEQDYAKHYEVRLSDAEEVALWVNNGPDLASALTQLLSIAGFPLTDRQVKIFAAAKKALAAVKHSSVALDEVEPEASEPIRLALDKAARVVENWALPTIQTPSMWLIDKAGIAAEIRALAE